MSLRFTIALLVAGSITAYFAWMARPDTADLAELADNCEFPGISSTQFRELVREAKVLIDAQRAVWQAPVERSSDSGGVSIPILGELTLRFLKPSNSTFETVARLHALVRALDGRIQAKVIGSAYRDEQKPSPGPTMTVRSSDPNWKHGQPPSQPRLRVQLSAQGGQWLFHHPTGRHFEAWLLGSRHEEFDIFISTFPPTKSNMEDVLSGRNILDVAFISYNRKLLWRSTRWGQERLPNRCPDMKAISAKLNIIAEEGL
jgi:hypothetical protein